MVTNCAKMISQTIRRLSSVRTAARAQARGSLGVILTTALGISVANGCREDVRLAGKNVRSAAVRTVTHYGVTLDQDASAEQVAYVLLRAIRDDFLAQDETTREAALDKQFDVCAANEIQKKNTTARSRDEFIHNVVWRWTPGVAHYVSDFETDLEQARSRFVRSVPDPSDAATGETRECSILMELTEPGGDPNAHVVLVIYFAKDNGYWRVLHLGFETAARSINKSGAAKTGEP